MQPKDIKKFTAVLCGLMVMIVVAVTVAGIINKNVPKADKGETSREASEESSQESAQELHFEEAEMPVTPPDYENLRLTQYKNLRSTLYPSLYEMGDIIVFPEETEEEHSSAEKEQSGSSEESSGGKKYHSGLRGSVERYKNVINRDTVGWIYIPDTRIDYAVVQAKDNEYYLYRDYYKNYKSPSKYPSATIFADYEVKVAPAAEMSWNTVLYGHNWYCHWEPARLEYPKNSMFANLSSYRYPSFADTHRKIYYSTFYENLTFDVFAVFYETTDYLSEYLIYPNMRESKRAEVISSALKKSEFDFGVNVTADDKIITLLTCSYRYTSDGSGRCIVMGKLSDVSE